MITFQAHRGDKPLSRAIRLLSPKYNHVSIKVGQSVYESHIFAGVTKTRYTEWDNSTVVESITFNVSGSAERRVRKFLEEQVGKKYDIFGIVSFIWGFTKPRKGKWYCSELAKVALYKMLGVKSTDDDYKQRVSPYQFWKEVKVIANIKI